MKKKNIQLHQKLLLGKTTIADLTIRNLQLLNGGAGVVTRSCEPATVQITVCIDITSPGPTAPCQQYQCP
ncbi:MAG TPA: class I lanthipeptide [Chitinophaga sp.]|uniref:class I lanthipeptide n=1 Tax=Chitinophaga sp. TaxID=1869181 RepID=UPI002C17A8A4|nr:class I lanthipeptide [Chitinophaga sp.]HVI45035.1 class I lanthipeptide [Chitinophaga sp.]